MNLILFDDPVIRLNLLPFTFTRPTSRIRVGILTIAEKWEKRLGVTPSYKTEPYLQEKFPVRPASDNLLVNGAVCPDDELTKAVKELTPGNFLVKNKILLAANTPEGVMNSTNTREYDGDVTVIDKLWKIFFENGRQIRADFSVITAGRKSARITDPHTIVYGADNLFVEEGVTIKAAIINAEPGPVYLGKNSIIQEGTIIRAPFALCEGGHINMGAKMRGDTTIGPYCKVGGEISLSVVFGYSNKSHDGFLGCSVIGEWCNLGADTNTSNLKNTYQTVKLWNHAQQDFESTGLQFCGLMMGDHSKAGINTMFNTGTVVDVAANIFGAGYVRQYLPSFTWGGTQNLMTHKLDKALETAARTMERRNMELGQIDRQILENVFAMTAPLRIWETRQ